MWAHIVIYKGVYDIVISKGMSNIYMHKMVALHYNSYKVDHIVNPINMGHVF